MNHNEYKKLIRLSLYGELNADEQNLIETHLEECDECRGEIEKQKNILTLISSSKTNEVDDALLLEARLQLRGAIRNERNHKRFYESSIQFFSNLIPDRFRLALSGAVLILVGFLSGYLFFNSAPIETVEQQQNENNTPSFNLADINISNINFIDSDPSDGEVEFTFDAIKPVYVKGRVDDPQIQSVLTFSMLNEQNPGVRLNSINALDNEEVIQFDNDVRDALITVLISDDNPGVRREALGLMKKLPFDEKIKQAYINVLTTDSSSSLKIEAINALVEAGKRGLMLNKTELDLFRQKLQTDENSYVRYRTKTILQEYD
jgi:hypothetical protein